MAEVECGSGSLSYSKPGSKRQGGQQSLPNFQNLPSTQPLAEK